MLGATRNARVITTSLRIISKRSLLSHRCSSPISQSWQDSSLPRPLRPSLVRPFSSYPRLPEQSAAAAVAGSHDAPQEFTKFSELAEHGLVSPKIIDTLVNRMKIHTMTDVQRMTINECLDGADIIAQAKTGTGKTLAFLMPIVQRILRDPNLESRSRRRASADDIRALIISPTRELAEQIAVEANKIVSGTAVKVQTAVGGTGKAFHLRKMVQEGCHILVGTPGRVKDILSDPYSGVRLDKIETFVLDEADRLLDIGFAPDIADIQSYMPPREQRARQTLMFSATVPKEVVSLVRQTLRPDFKFVRTVDPDEAPTHERIPQHVVFCRGLQNQLPAILEIATRAIEAHRRDPTNNMPFKAIVYFGSTNEVTLASQAFENMREPNSSGSGTRMFSPHPLSPTLILEMHSKLSQNMRTANSMKFRRAETAILFSSDVTARGMDFPNVSHVIQIGLPRSADDYVHRIGRTGRAGKSGEGWLLLTDDQRHQYRRQMVHSGIKIDENTMLETAQLDMTQPSQLPAPTARILQLIESGVKTVPYGQKAQTYASLLGVLSMGGGRAKQTVIDLMNDLARYGWGLEKPPGMSMSLVNKLGFRGVRGIEIDDTNSRESGRSTGRGGFNDRDPFGMGAESGTGAFRAGGDRGASGGGRNGFGGDRGGDRGSFGRDRGGNRRGGFGGVDRRGGFDGGDRRSASSGFGRGPRSSFDGFRK